MIANFVLECVRLLPEKGGDMTPAPRKLYQRIAEVIARQIASGRYPIGTRLPPERDLAEELAVSRPTIREAMIALEMRGVIESRQGSGILVIGSVTEPATSADFDVGAFELIEARVLIEGEAAALAATSIDEETIAALRALVKRMEAEEDHPGKVMIDRDFHLMIASATANSLVKSAVETLWDVRVRSPLCVNMFARAQREGVTPRAQEHVLIVDALAAHDGQAAREAMRAHLRRVTEDLLAATQTDIIERAQADFDAQRARVKQRVLI